MSPESWRAELIRRGGALGERSPRLAPLLRRLRGFGHAGANAMRWANLDARDLRAQLNLALALASPPVRPLLEPNSRTIVRSSKGGGPRAAICSMATGGHVELLAIGAPTLLEYGDRHGWDVVLSTESSLADGRPASWGKVQLIRQLLHEYELVWWIDADALIVDSTMDVRDHVRYGKDLYLVEHMFELGFAASCGVMLWRASDWSQDLLTEMWSMDEHIDQYPWENGALLNLLGYRSEPFFYHAHPTPRMARVSLLPCDWNSVWPDPGPTPRVNHHGGTIGHDERRLLMLSDLARVRHGQPADMTGPHATVYPTAVGEWTYLTEARPAATMTRGDIPLMLNERGLTGAGAEVGVFAAEFSARLLRTWCGENLLSIDPWMRMGDDYIDVSNVEQEEFEALYHASCARLERFGSRSTIWRVTSAVAAAKVEDASFDFAYIDARHDEPSVREDLQLWFPKVRPGGILAGHDFLDGDLPEGQFGVKSAVESFFGGHSLPIYVTGEEKFASWIVEIPA